MDKNSLHRTKLGELSFNAFYFSFCYADLPHVRLVNAARCRRHSMPNQGIAMFDQFNPHGGVKDFLLLLLFELFIPFFVLVDEVTKNKNRLCDFLYEVFRLQGKTGKTKMKNIKKHISFRTTPWHLQIAYEGEMGRLCTVTFWGKVDFLISNTS